MFHLVIMKNISEAYDQLHESCPIFIFGTLFVGSQMHCDLNRLYFNCCHFLGEIVALHRFTSI
jgi:hypothetical protein